MSDLEIWVSEHQEQVSVLIKPDDYMLIKEAAEAENVSSRIVGTVTNTGQLSLSHTDPNKLVMIFRRNFV